MEPVWKFANIYRIYTSNGSRFGNLSNREGAEWQKFLISSPPNILLLCPSPGVGSSANFGDGPELTTRDPIVWKCEDRPSCRHLSTTHQQSISTKVTLPSVFYRRPPCSFPKDITAKVLKKKWTNGGNYLIKIVVRRLSRNFSYLLVSWAGRGEGEFDGWWFCGWPTAFFF